jgi:hypothetical protein
LREYRRQLDNDVRQQRKKRRLVLLLADSGKL